MQRSAVITFRGITHSDAVEQRVRNRIAKLEHYFDRITGCHVIIEARHQRHHQGNLYAAHVDLRVPGEEIVGGSRRPLDHAHEDVYVAIRDAFDAVARRLEDYVRRRRYDVKQHETPEHGRVSQMVPERGYGFIRLADGTEVYFHEHSLVGVEMRNLAIGHEVRVTLADHPADKGPHASTVTLVGKHHVVARRH
jgi:ribosomal subunit interface protein